MLAPQHALGLEAATCLGSAYISPLAISGKNVMPSART